MKTNKSFSKRLKVTRNGKILARQPGFNHFNSRQSRTEQLSGRKLAGFTIKAKPLSRVMPNCN
jgi:ribosomal protein L35